MPAGTKNAFNLKKKNSTSFQLDNSISVKEEMCLSTVQAMRDKSVADGVLE